jgi:hypothetical protein
VDARSQYGFLYIYYKGIFLVGILMRAGLSKAAPVIAAAAPHSFAEDTTFQLPPFISSCAQPVIYPSITGDLNAESNSAIKNKKSYSDHSGNLKALGKRDTITAGSNILDLPFNVPPETITSFLQ